MVRNVLAILAALILLAHAQERASPEQYFGFPIGADKKLVRYDQAAEYLEKLAARNPRVRFRNLGLTTGGNRYVMLEISSAANIANLDHLRGLERKLYFQGGAPTPEQREQIFREGKAVVFITNSVHSTEIGASQMAIELAYRLATEDSPEVRTILNNVIVLLAPCANPDGQMLVTGWYNKYVGTPFEGVSPPWLYHPYAGHDINRDMFLLSQRESQIAADVLWHDWFPAVWLDEHQQAATGARIFTMPSSDPINPNVHPLIYRWNTILGQIQAGALEAAGKNGILHHSNYVSNWEGAMAWAGWWHNQVGLLTEVANARIASPVTQQMASPARAGAGSGAPVLMAPPSQPGPDVPLPPPRDTISRSDYPRPWLGGTWRLRDIVDYELISTMALLGAAADNRETLLRQIYEVNRSTVEAGASGTLGFGDPDPEYAALIPLAGQRDSNEAAELVEKLMLGGVEVYRARQEFSLHGAKWAAGTYVVPFAQVFGRYAKDLLEVQNYPDAKTSLVSGDNTYDVSAWSLGMQFGVRTEFAREPLPAGLGLDPVTSPPKRTFIAERIANGIRFPYTGPQSALIVNRLLRSGAAVSIAGDWALAHASPDAWEQATRGFEVTLRNAAGAGAEAGTPLRAPRIGLYQSWTANIDEGWTRWVLEHYGFSYSTLHNADVQAGGLRAKFDAIVLPDQTKTSLMEGQETEALPREFRGGLGSRGLQALREFVEQGGTLIALGEASSLVVDSFPLPVKDLKRTLLEEQHDGPGTIVNLQIDTAHPLGWGLAADTFGFYTNSPIFQVTEGFTAQKTRVVARYPNRGVRASGWLHGEDHMLGRAAVVAVEMNPGKVALFGIRPQHRAQSHATLPLFFNALYWSAEGDLAAGWTQ